MVDFEKMNAWQKACSRVANLVQAKTVFEWNGDAGLKPTHESTDINRNNKVRARSVFAFYCLDELIEPKNSPKSDEEIKLEQALKATVHVDVWKSLDLAVSANVDVQKTVQESYNLDIINKGCELLDGYTNLNRKLERMKMEDMKGGSKHKKKALSASKIEAEIKPIFETSTSGFRVPVIPKPARSKLNVKTPSPEKEFKLGREIIWGSLAKCSESEKLMSPTTDQERRETYRMGKYIINSRLNC